MRGRPFNIKTTDTSISISDHTGNEMLYWDIVEWAESPETTLSITNAIVMALTDPKTFTKTISDIEKGKQNE